MQVRVHLANLEKGHKAVSQVFDEYTDALHPDGPVSTSPKPPVSAPLCLSACTNSCLLMQAHGCDLLEQVSHAWWLLAGHDCSIQRIA